MFVVNIYANKPLWRKGIQENKIRFEIFLFRKQMALKEPSGIKPISDLK